MTVMERFLAASDGIWQGYHDHPFVRGIADGSLDPEKFKFYMVQDYLYLIDYLKVFSLGAAKAADLETAVVFATYAKQISGGEMSIHRSYMERLGIDLEEAEKTPVSLDNLSYTSYMIREAYEGDAAAVMASVLACAVSYEVIACEMLKQNPRAGEHPFYGEWVRGYSDPEYHKGNEELIDIMDRLCKGASEEKLEKLTEIFVNCSRYEAAFWDMAWEMRS